MKVTLTGAAGRVGSAVCGELAKAGHELRAVDKVVRRDLPVRVEPVNLLDRVACYGVLEGAEAVVHLANHPTVRGGDAQQVFNENVAVNMNVFQAAAELGVQKIIFASSVQVISGRLFERDPDSCCLLPYLPADGDVPANPGNPYALSKHVSEVMLEYFARHHAMSCIAVRFPLMVTPEMAARWRRNPGRPISGHDEAHAWLYPADGGTLVEAILRASLPGFRVYLPSARSTGFSEPAAETIRERFAGIPLRQPLEQITSLVDISRITEETGWVPTHNGLA